MSADLSRAVAEERKGKADPGAARLGLLPATLSAISAGLACWFVVLPQVAAGERTQVAAGESRLAEVELAEVSAAIATLEPSATFTTQARSRPDSCGLKLAWISIVRAPDAPPGTVRILSGGYASPIFTLPDSPMRIAIPYPAPYEAGRGMLTLLDAGGAGIVALGPAVRIAGGGRATQVVTWGPTDRCPAKGG